MLKQILDDLKRVVNQSLSPRYNAANCSCNLKNKCQYCKMFILITELEAHINDNTQDPSGQIPRTIIARGK